jgi:hypothetical protein
VRVKASASLDRAGGVSHRQLDLGRIPERSLANSMDLSQSLRTTQKVSLFICKLWVVTTGRVTVRIRNICTVSSGTMV